MRSNDVTPLIDHRSAIGYPNTLHVEKRGLRAHSKLFGDFGCSFTCGEFAKLDQLRAWLLARGLCLVREAHETLQIVIEHALANERASTLTDLEQSSRYEAAKGLVRCGAAGFKSLGDLSLGEKLGSWRELSAAQKFAKLFNELLMKRCPSGHGGHPCGQFGL